MLEWRVAPEKNGLEPYCWGVLVEKNGVSIGLICVDPVDGHFMKRLNVPSDYSFLAPLSLSQIREEIEYRVGKNVTKLNYNLNNLNTKESKLVYLGANRGNFWFVPNEKFLENSLLIGIENKNIYELKEIISDLNKINKEIISKNITAKKLNQKKKLVDTSVTDNSIKSIGARSSVTWLLGEVPYYYQYSSSWCWAFSLAMQHQWWSPEPLGTGLSQASEIANYLNKDWDDGGSLGDIERVMKEWHDISSEYESYQTVYAGSGKHPFEDGQPTGYTNDIKSWLDYYGSPVIVAGDSDNDWLNIADHAVVVIGYSDAYDIIYINNPGHNVHGATGADAAVSYSDFNDFWSGWSVNFAFNYQMIGGIPGDNNIVTVANAGIKFSGTIKYDEKEKIYDILLGPGGDNTAAGWDTFHAEPYYEDGVKIELVNSNDGDTSSPVNDGDFWSHTPNPPDDWIYFAINGISQGSIIDDAYFYVKPNKLGNIWLEYLWWVYDEDDRTHTLNGITRIDNVYDDRGPGTDNYIKMMKPTKIKAVYGPFQDSFTVNGVDLTVTSVNAPTSAEVGDYIAVSWTVKNQGNAASGSFYNRIFLATTPYGTDISLGGFTMSSIPAGSSLPDAENPKISETVSPWYYYVTVFADAFDDVDESDEDNNINKAPNQICINGNWGDDPGNPCKERRVKCSGGYEYKNKDDGTDCGTDYCGDWENYCKGDEVWKKCLWHNFYCEGGICTDHATSWKEEFVENCDDGDSCTEDSCTGAGVCTYESYCSGTDTDCGCTSCENCNTKDSWEDKGSPYSCCDGNKKCTCQVQEYWDWYCDEDGTSCTHKVTGEPRIEKTSCTTCDDGNPCTEDSCSDGVCIHGKYCPGTDTDCGCTSCENCNDYDHNYCDGDAVWFEDWGCTDYECKIVDTGLVKDCNDLDDWYCNGDTLEYRDYYCSDGSCSYSVTDLENCNDYDEWVDTGNKRWITDPENECKEKEEKEQEFHDFSCSGGKGGSCEYSVTGTQWVKTGETRDKPDGTDCGCTANNTRKECSEGTCSDTGKCNATICNADIACDGKKPGDLCAADKRCNSTCNCVLAEPKLCTEPDPPDHDFGIVRPGKTRTWSFEIANCGDPVSTLGWSVRASEPWISVSPSSGTNTTVTVTIDTRLPEGGVKTGTINIASNGGTKNGTIRAEVKLETAPPGEEFATFATTDGFFEKVEAVVEETLPEEGKPSGVEFPHGFFSFRIENLSAESVTVEIELPSEMPAGAEYWKYGRTPDNPAPHWYKFMYDEETGTGAKIDGKEVRLHFVDGKRGDDDLGKDGKIEDDGGPGSPPALPPPVPVPEFTPTGWRLGRDFEHRTNASTGV